MGRRPRVPSDTGYYHLVSRGNRREAVFRQPADYAAYCRFVAAACRKYQCSVAHFCLMSNHVHLLTRASDIGRLSQAMHHIQRRYWFHIQHTYALTGHLWQGRFHSFPIEDEAYLLEAARYIERNPLEATLVVQLEDYPWSSYPSYVQGCPAPIPLAPTPVYEALGRIARTRQRAYRTFVETPRPYDRSTRHRLQEVTAYA